MSTSRDLPRAGILLATALLSSCATPDERAATAPLTGRVGGAALGAGIGSISGNAGSGALLGMLFGGLGGDLYRAEDRSNRVIDPVGTVKNAPSAIREATRARATQEDTRATLALRISRAKAAGDTNTLLISRAEASRHEAEARMWQRRMQDTANSLDLAAAGRLPVPPGDYDTLQRNRVFARGLHGAFGQLAGSFHALAR